MKKKYPIFIDIIFLIAITIITYWPVSFFIFSLKNDSLVQYLPFRYHLSESIQNGYFPFWSPYLYTGFPIHADMQGMTWNPIVLIISLFTRYNMTVLQFEVTIYLILAAIGMYLLLKSFSFHRLICIVGAVSYMSCGFINGSASVIPWVSSAAFIPFVFKYMKDLLYHTELKTALLFGIFFSLLFLCGYPTFFIFTSYVIAAVCIFFIRKNVKKKPVSYFTSKSWLFGLSILIFLLICSPAILSYWDFLPYYQRGAGISAAKAAENPFTPFSSISFFFPGAVLKNHQYLNTDISMRNSYVGLFIFSLCALSFRTKYTSIQKLIAGISLFSLLLSFGSALPVHKLSFNILPLFNTFRHPGNIRLFTSIGIILLAAFYAQKLSERPIEAVKNKIQPFLYFLIAITGILAISLLFKKEVLMFWKEIKIFISNPKLLLDQKAFYQFLFIHCLLQIGFILMLLYTLKKKSSPQKIAGITIFNSIFFCWFALPFTFISQIKTTSVNEFIQYFPDNYPIQPINEPINASTISDSTEIPVQGYTDFYAKKITIQDHIITPTLNKDYETFLADSELRKIMNNYPYAYFADTVIQKIPTQPSDIQTGIKKVSIANLDFTITRNKESQNPEINISTFTPNHFSFITNTKDELLFSLFQQYNHNWKATINDKEASVIKTNIAFMGVIVPPGKNIINFVYQPKQVIKASFVSLTTIIFTLLLLIILQFKKNYEKKR